MHYKNGREAKNGDMIMLVPPYNTPVVGILYNAKPGNDFCNGNIALTTVSDPLANLSEYMHIDDIKAAVTESREISPGQVSRISDDALSRYLKLVHKSGAALPDTNAFAQAVQCAVLAVLSTPDPVSVGSPDPEK